MTNATIEFFPTENPISPVPDPEAPYTINVTLTQFARSDDTATTQLKTKSGIVSSSHFYDTPTYSCRTLEAGRDGEPTVEEMEMFASSTLNSEEFTVTNLDESDRAMIVQNVGRARQDGRSSSADVGMFPYSFTVREVI